MEPTELLESPRGGLPPISELFQPDSMVPAGMAVLGDVLWMVAYVVAIVIGFRRKTYGLPILAVCLNITWEFVYTVIHTPESKMVLGLHLVWLLIDIVILYQVFRFGRGSEANRPIQRIFPLAVLGMLALCLVGHLTWHAAQTKMAIFPDTLGITSAFVINLVMSVLFVSLFLRHPDHPGLSLPVAWLKMIGTALISLANVFAFVFSTAPSFDVQVRRQGAPEWVEAGTIGAHNFDPGFSYFLFASIFVFDVLYIWLLTRHRKEASSEATA